MIDPTNPVVALCAAGMAAEGTPSEARDLFEQAWSARTNDFESCIAAHYLARHQPTPELTFHWNELAARHAEAVGDDSVRPLLASLYLNLADSHLALGRHADARAVGARAEEHLVALEPGGYRDLVAQGIRRVIERASS